jgi:hypothetical protein
MNHAFIYSLYTFVIAILLLLSWLQLRHFRPIAYTQPNLYFFLKIESILALPQCIERAKVFGCPK